MLHKVGEQRRLSVAGRRAEENELAVQMLGEEVKKASATQNIGTAIRRRYLRDVSRPEIRLCQIT